jgi:protoporphyrinogen/coproporphyrinogen III oxidase
MSGGQPVVVVGAGITGLALAYHLRALDVPHVVLESGDRVGGVIRSERVQGHLLEWGPQRTRLTLGIRELVEELGLLPQVVTAPAGLPLFVYRDGRLRRVPFSLGDFLRSDIVPAPAKLRPLLEPFTAAARADESVANFFVRKLGRPIYENIAGPLYGGLYASDPADMVVGLSLQRVLEEFGIRRSLVLPLLRRGGRIDPPLACSFDEGMRTLPEALYAANAENVRLGTPARKIHRAGAEWSITVPGGTIGASAVVLTTPADVTARLLEEIDRPASHRLEGLTYNPLAVVHLYARTDLNGLGYQVSLAETLATRGVTFNDSLFGRSGVYTAYLGGAHRPDVLEMDDELIGTLGADEFRQVTGYRPEVVSVARERMPAWDRSWKGLVGLELPTGIHLAANWESRPGIPGRLAQAKRLAGAIARKITPAAGGGTPSKEASA